MKLECAFTQSSVSQSVSQQLCGIQTPPANALYDVCLDRDDPDPSRMNHRCKDVHGYQICTFERIFVSKTILKHCYRLAVQCRILTDNRISSIIVFVGAVHNSPTWRAGTHEGVRARAGQSIFDSMREISRLCLLTSESCTDCGRAGRRWVPQPREGGFHRGV